MLSVIWCFQMQSFKIKFKKRLSLGAHVHLVLFSTPLMCVLFERTLLLGDF